MADEGTLTPQAPKRLMTAAAAQMGEPLERYARSIYFDRASSCHNVPFSRGILANVLPKVIIGRAQADN